MICAMAANNDPIELYEGEDKGVPYSLSYDSTNWSNPAQQGDPVLQSEVARLYFYVRKDKDSAPFITITDAAYVAGAAGIEWTLPLAGGIRIWPATSTQGFPGRDYVYELRAKFVDGRFITIASGKFHILDSVVERP